eukprot:CAMPEP_0205911486 /NCGR_PEP_ID=MMETSP1325-20131115/5183_1 /ASSEMBLY_ACC=CAM_ASM_000708 /TAXON_ID=236786 /ORGANISM="Florenciella sp., Strain RCC1007" /LENGTH=38 /DNA_ID= /DNA_START= /DNA_END= /DNA_ORIENTATION=
MSRVRRLGHVIRVSVRPEIVSRLVAQESEVLIEADRLP